VKDRFCLYRAMAGTALKALAGGSRTGRIDVNHRTGFHAQVTRAKPATNTGLADTAFVATRLRVPVWYPKTV
jgi:hypothetical protein